MLACATYHPQQSLTAFQSWSVGVCNAGIRRTHAYNYSTTQIAYTQCYSTSNYTAPQKLGWMSTSNQLRTGSPMAEMELHHSADAHLQAAHRPSGSAVLYALYAGGQRAMAEHIEHGQVTLVRHHVGDAEVDIDPRTDRRTYRLRVQTPMGVAAVIESDGSTKGAAVSYVHTDFQGSWTLLTDADGQAITRQAFDAWGRPRNPLNWAPLPEGHGICMLGQRGYTGHEHLPALGLIHMNGRAYAPGLQRFLSPDPFLQDPANAQNHNRYAYCLNNPLRYTDPSGYIHAPAVPYDNDRDIIEDPWWSSGWASALGRGTPLAWTTRIPSIGGYGGSIIVTRVADAGHGAYRVSSTGRYQTVDIFGAHGGYTRYISPWLGTSGATGTHFFYDLPPGATADSWGYSPSRYEGMGGGGRMQWCSDGSYNYYGSYGGGSGGRTGGGSGISNRGVNSIVEVASTVNSTAGPYMSWGGVVGAAAEAANAGHVAKTAADLQVEKMLTKVGKIGKGLGVAGSLLSVGIDAFNAWENPTARNKVKLGVSVGIVIVGVIPYVGPIISFGFSAYELGGGFDWLYDMYDDI